jgi:Ca-activated chloride channel homolog
MTFIYPSALWLIVLVPIALSGFVLYKRRTQKRIVADPAILDQFKRRPVNETWRLITWSIALIALIIALARPIWGIAEEIIEAEGIAVIVLIDVSRSMDARDLAPSRLERAKITVRQLFETETAVNFGLVAFAESAFVAFPLTNNTPSMLNVLDSVSTQMIGNQGTNFNIALQTASDVIDPRFNAQTALIILSDGETHEPTRPGLLSTFSDAGIPIHTVGYGTLDGSPIPTVDAGNVIGPDGETVITRLDDTALQIIAQQSGGIYRRAAESGIEVVDLLNVIREMSISQSVSASQIRRVERFGIFVFVAIVALLASPMKPRQFSVSLMLVLAGCAGPVENYNNAGNRSFSSGAYAQAVEAYQQAQVVEPDEAASYYNAGTAYLAADDVDQAIVFLGQALLTADPALLPDIYYNLGNAYAAVNRNIDAIDAYQNALRLQPDDDAARYNLEVVTARLNQPTPTAQIPQPEDTPPTPTPTPPANSMPEDESDNLPDETEGTMDPAAAEALLDRIQQDQNALQSFMFDVGGEGRSDEKDW